MAEKRLHIVSFDVPFPADYGGVIDVFYRLKALHELGIKITLHCFEYGRGQAPELEQFAEKVIYYNRRKSVLDVFNRLPFVVKTRISKELLNNLLADENPILFEGLHTTYLLNDERLKTRNKIVRMHNIEHEYYDALGKQSRGFRKRFYQSEAIKLQNFEAQLEHANHILAIKKSDANHFSKYSKNVHLIPACADTSTTFGTATLPYCLFQGNLSVPENEQGLLWLIDHVFLPYNLTNKLKIAGKAPSKTLLERCSQLQIDLHSNPNSDEMDRLSAEARVHVFYSEQATGIKLKMVNALRTSGSIVANKNILDDPNFGALCEEANDPETYAEKINEGLLNPLNNETLNERAIFIQNHLNPKVNCEIILALL